METKIRNKKGQTIELIGGTVLGFMVLVFIVVAVLFGISALNPGSFFTAGSLERNTTTLLTQNLTTGVGQFAGYIPTVFLVLGVVLALSAIAVLIIYVKRMAGGGTASL